MMDSEITNILASRYATPEMKAIWSTTGRLRLEREFWIAVMEAQNELGLDIPAEAIEAYRSVIDDVDLDSIRRRESITRHDVKARLEEFSHLAGQQHAHKGLTSRDLTENVEQLQVYRGLKLLLGKVIAVLARMSERAVEWQEVVLTGRTHNVAAQPTTMGKRIAMFGEELLFAVKKLEQIIDEYLFHGLKGAVGTQSDQLSLFNGDSSKVSALESIVLKKIGASASFSSIGQVYPRSLDFEVVSALLQVASAPAGMSLTLRLMAGHDLASEGFAPGQVGSSVMPHKMNSRSCERIQGFKTLLQGYLAMAAELSGAQWNEGDVSCSVVRRVMLPDSFFALDGLLETFLAILSQLEIYPEVIEEERREFGPFLATTRLLMAAVARGAGREDAHAAIKQHAVAAAKLRREGKTNPERFINDLAADQRLNLDIGQIESLLEEGSTVTGNAVEQVTSFNARVGSLTEKYPEASSYPGKAIL